MKNSQNETISDKIINFVTISVLKELNRFILRVFQDLNNSGEHKVNKLLTFFQYHYSVDVALFCSKAIVTRLGYVVCDNCCKYLDIELVPGRHVPSKAKVQVASRSNTASYASSVVVIQILKTVLEVS